MNKIPPPLDGSGHQPYFSPARANLTATPIKLALMPLLLLLLPGCVNADGESDSRGVKLSQAMQASATGSKQDLGGNTPSETCPGGNTTVTTDTTGFGDFTEVSYDKSEYRLQLPVDVSYALPINSTIEGITHFTVTPVAFEDERNFFGGYVGGAIVDLKSGSLPDLGVQNAWLLDTGLTYRRYLNSSQPAFSPYVTASAGYVLLNWQYRNSVVAGGQTISSDSLNGAEGMVGFGVSTRRDSRVSCFGEVDLGGTVFASTTNQGFDNDVFHNFGFVLFKAGVTFKF